ncbi:hypothetical protein [Desulfosporosinus sp. I2]|uniref:hypothetical protein n=1 Tax=Desulfosporosinus sp. I2 TaxID=1617025 RepID=UPI000696A004|nr:hypothetical protein [Desulfosporosinus sp. I2]
MIIKRITCVNLIGLGNVQWTFSEGPVILFMERSIQKKLNQLIVELFYDLKMMPLRSEVTGQEGSVEVWIVRDNMHYYIRKEFFKQEIGQEPSSILEIKDQDGRILSLPDSMVLGEYLFSTKLDAFRQSGIIEWPESNDRDYFLERVRNLSQGGDEDFSLGSVRASLAGAQKKVKDQKESMEHVKAEYDTLRSEWEAAHLLLDEERLFQIEIKNLREKDRIITEKIERSVKIQERLTLHERNPDYRELCHLKGVLSRLEERLCGIVVNLKSLTSDSQVDLTLIDSLREECMEWAFLQKQVDKQVSEVESQSRIIGELQEFLQLSVYYGMSKGEDERLILTEEERVKAQDELKQINTTKDDYNQLQNRYLIERAQLQDLEIMAGVTEAEEIKVAHRENYLKQWQRSKIGAGVDRIFKKRLGQRSIFESLSTRLIHYYKNYQTVNYEEFITKLEKYKEQRVLVEKMYLEIELLQEKLSVEDKLQKIVSSCQEILIKAFSAINVPDLPAWLQGWHDYQRKNYELTQQQEELHQKQVQLSITEQTLAACVEHLRDKLKSWGKTTTEREEVLAIVLKVAQQLRAREEVEKESSEFLQKFQDLLGGRDFAKLVKVLEPMEELEDETCFSDEERQEKLSAWHEEQAETNRRLKTAEQSLKSIEKLPSIAILEKKIESVKQQWTAYQNLYDALNDVQTLLEASCQEWQAKYGLILNQEMQWIHNRISISESKVTSRNDLLDAKRDYFSYRMALGQLALRDNTEELPMFFSVGELHEEEVDSFWNSILEFLRKLSISRQVIFCIATPTFPEKLLGKGWQLGITE